MTDHPIPVYVSIAECDVCRGIPQKVSEDSNHDPSVIPAEVDRLQTVVELIDENTHPYCTSLTRLLKCPRCGTYYYYNHYDDDGEQAFDPTSDSITVRRYAPLTARDFLERVVYNRKNALPASLDQLKKAFAEGQPYPDTQISSQGLDAKAQAAAAELEELNRRSTSWMDELRDLLRSNRLSHNDPSQTTEKVVAEPFPPASHYWQIKTYLVDTFIQYFLAQDDWEALRSELLHHPDPVIRLSTAMLLIGVATGDAPVTDLIHVTRKMMSASEKGISLQGRLDELAAVLVEIVFAEDSYTFEYDNGFQSSKYWHVRSRWVALYGLVVAAGHGAELAGSIPALVNLLPTDQWITDRVCWVLRTLAKQKKGNASLILAELEKISGRRKQKLMKDKHIQQLVEECNR